MGTPGIYERLHWAIFNILAKVFGVLGTFICTVGCLLILLEYFGVLKGNNYELISLVFLIPLLYLCWKMIFVKPYRPKEYEDWYASRPWWKLW